MIKSFTKNKNKFFSLGILFCLFFFRVASAQWDPDSLAEYQLPGAAVSDIVENIFYWIFGIVGLISLLSFMIAGFLYLTASGDDKQVEKAKKAMEYSIKGIIVALSGFVIVQAVSLMLNADNDF